MPEGWSFVDRRFTASGLQVGGLSETMSSVHKAASPKVVSGAEVIQANNDANNRTSQEFKSRRLETRRVTGSNIQIAQPKVRVPGQNLVDKGIPTNVHDPKELKEIHNWCRLFYATHDLIPLLVDIYSQFPLVGLEFDSDDPLIKNFYESMFFDELNYEEFLPNVLGREFFVVGEVTTLAHFNESLGVWSSEEVLDPHRLLITKSMFVDRERVQLLVKEMVEALRDGPGGGIQETPSQMKERRWQYDQLKKYFPEFIKAAQQDDGVDLSDALVSRLVNKAFDNDLRGTPHMMRSFDTLMQEQSIRAAMDAVADRMYSPLILAKLGLPSLGADQEPWLPDPSDLDAVRDDLEAALRADFKLMVGNVGLDIQSVFGREILPRFGEDFARIDKKIMQAWGIGEALISGGTQGGGAYASSALNREFASNLMSKFQKMVTRHIIKRSEVIAEAQEHYDSELAGGIRRPLFREIVRTNPETGEEEIVRVPKLKIAEPRWKTLNLRDEAQERQFLQMLKQAGVPVSDGALSINVDIDFTEELEASAEETVKKGLAQAQAMDKLKRLCDAEELVYPPELVNYMQATLALRGGIAQTDMVEGQAKMQDAQMKSVMPAGQMGLFPPPGGGAPGGPPPPQPQPGVPQAQPPGAAPPSATGPEPGGPGPQEIPRNRQRPAESDEQRGSQPRAAKRKKKVSKLTAGPSSYGKHLLATEEDAERAVRRLELVAKGPGDAEPKVAELVQDPDFYAALNASHKMSRIAGNFDQIRSGQDKEGARMLYDLLDQHQEIFGTYPQW